MTEREQLKALAHLFRDDCPDAFALQPILIDSLREAGRDAEADKVAGVYLSTTHRGWHEDDPHHVFALVYDQGKIIAHYREEYENDIRRQFTHLIWRHLSNWCLNCHGIGHVYAGQSAYHCQECKGKQRIFRE